LIQIIEVQVYTIDDNEFGHVTDGYLIHGGLTPAAWFDERFPAREVLNLVFSLHFKGVKTEAMIFLMTTDLDYLKNYGVCPFTHPSA
jgi:hypothetical protein